MSPDDGPDYSMAQSEQEREQQQALDSLEWWEIRQINQSYGMQQGITTAPDLESNHAKPTPIGGRREVQPLDDEDIFGAPR